MRSGGLAIHEGLANMSVFHSCGEALEKSVLVEDGFLDEVFDEDSSFGVLSDVHSFILFEIE